MFAKGFIFASQTILTVLFVDLPDLAVCVGMKRKFAAQSDFPRQRSAAKREEKRRRLKVAELRGERFQDFAVCANPAIQEKRTVD